MKLALQTILLCIILLPTQAIAQGIILRGTVHDNAKEPLIGATVYIQNKENRILTGALVNIKGEYSLTIPADAKGVDIVFSYVGFITKKVPYTGQTVLNVILDADNTELEAVTISGKKAETNSMGVNVKDLGVARQKIDITDIQDMPVTSVGDMLQGKLANVDIVATSGDPGAKMSIRIRGASSLNGNNEPLIVIDGIPYDTEIASDFEFATATGEDIGALVSISPYDIESIEVLKDAAATAIWGSKAANGVLLITTKKGTKGKPKFSIAQKFNMNKEPKGIPMLDANQYVTLIQDAIWNQVRDRGFPHGGLMNNLTKFPDIRFDPSYTYFDEFNQNTDWLNLVTQNAFSSQTDFSMSGGGDRASYRFSLGYTNEEGTTIGTGLERITTRLNVDYKFSNKFNVSSSFSYTETTKENNMGAYKDGVDGVRTHARKKMPNMSPYILDPNGKSTSEYFIQPTDCIQGNWESNKSYNPVAMAYESINDAKQRDIRVAFNLRYNIVAGLLFSEDIGFDLGSTKTQQFLPASATGVPWTHADYNIGSDNMSNKMNITTSSKLVYNLTLKEKHKIVLSGMLNTTSNSSSGYNSGVSSIGSSELSDPSAGGKITTLGSSETEYRNIALLGNAHYNYADRYMLSYGIRYEGNSRMGKNKRWGSLPSASIAWRISEEAFLKEINWIDEIKLRGSWGKNGVSPSGNYSYIGKFAIETSYIGLSAIKPASVQLNNLKWEVVTQYNAGVDLHLWNNKIGIVAEVYKKVTDDLLQTDVPVQSTSGFGKIGFFNSGKLENRGWELMFDFVDVIKIGELRIGFTNVNLSRNRNRVLELPSNLNFEKYTFGNGNYAFNVKTGNPLGSFYGYRCLGVYQTIDETYARDINGNIIQDIYGKNVITTVNGRLERPGDAKYQDINYDGVIDKYDIVYLGNSMPILTGGATMNVTYKGLRLRAAVQSRYGQSVINKGRINSENMRSADNQSTAVLKRWRYEGDQTNIPRALYQEGYNYLGSDRFVEKASFIRLKDLALSYSVPKKILDRIGFQRMIWNFNAYDLFTWTNYKGQDPEVGQSGGDIYQLAEDNNFTPRPRRYSVGLSIEF